MNTCAACGGKMTMESLHADGATYSCPCGRTRMTVLADGNLDPKPRPDYDPKADWPERYTEGPI